MSLGRELLVRPLAMTEYHHYYWWNVCEIINSFAILIYGFLCYISLLLAAFYYTLGNLHPMYRSTTRTIQLLAIAKTDAIKEYGIEVLLKPMIEEVKCL